VSFHKKNKSNQSGVKMPSQRQLRVGEDLRHLIANVFVQGDIFHPDLEGVSVTVTHVSVGPDLRQATVSVIPLGFESEEDMAGIVKTLNEITPQVRHAIAPKITFKNVPSLRFKLDTSFSYGAKIDALLFKQ
jgi:ribosome-binding factor A